MEQDIISWNKEDLRNEFGCFYDINQWRTMEVINVFDVNADGVLVTFKFTQYL